MATLTRAQATTILRRLGWRVRTTSEFTRCVRHFQAGWNLGTALSVDGSVGAKTSAALLKSEARRKAEPGHRVRALLLRTRWPAGAAGSTARASGSGRSAGPSR